MSDTPNVWRIYRRGEQPWEDEQWGALFEKYPYVATTKHVAGIHPGCAFEFNYYDTLEEAVSDMIRVMTYPWRQGDVLELPGHDLPVVAKPTNDTPAKDGTYRAKNRKTVRPDAH